MPLTTGWGPGLPTTPSARRPSPFSPTPPTPSPPGCAGTPSTSASPADPRRGPVTPAPTTSGNQTSAQLYLHGWYGAGTYYADDVVLDGPGGNTPGTPTAPGTPQTTAVTGNSIALSWGASAGSVTGYRVYEGATAVATVTGTSATVSGLAACTTHSYSVAAYNSAGESPKSATVSASTSGCVDTGLPKHALVGYLHAGFANGSGYVRMADVPAAWDIIDLAFGEPTSVTSGDIRFTRCPVAECRNVESDADFVAAIKANQAQGKKVLRPLAVAQRRGHRLPQPDHARRRQPDLRAEDAQGQIRLGVRAHDGAGDLLRAGRLPVLRRLGRR
ncbi:fibronectin type III domain-containing protein [Amycolatopsis sp. lyj-109]|uniref:fibronectin type III domain-containing protein n=1 Tax=Amycolatopsis sp. lyj-109 TaxID=2789287 RepID=UPI00397C1E52